MSRYYFHVFDDAVIVDREGIELPDAHAAHDQAIMRATAIMAESVTGFIKVEDDSHQLLFTVSFAEAYKR